MRAHLWPERGQNSRPHPFHTNTLDFPDRVSIAAAAESSVSQPGVGMYAYQRVVYNYPGITQTMPNIATIGLAGGTGFTANGIITVASTPV